MLCGGDDVPTFNPYSPDRKLSSFVVSFLLFFLGSWHLSDQTDVTAVGELPGIVHVVVLELAHLGSNIAAHLKLLGSHPAHSTI